MNAEVLNYIVESFFRLTAIPCRIYHKKRLIKNFYLNADSFLLTTYDEQLLDNPNPVGFLLTDEYLAIGRIICKDSNDSIIFGPVRTGPISNDSLQEFLLAHDIPLTDANKLRTQFDNMTKMDLEYYAAILASVYCSINHELIRTSVILRQIPSHSEPDNTAMDTHLLSRQEAIIFGDKEPHNTYNYEQKMLHCVKYGLVEELNSIGGLTNDMHIGTLLTDSIRYYKNLLLAQNTLFSRAAIEGGLAPEAAYSMSDLYVLQIENCETINQLNQVSQTIRNDFCKSVRDIRSPQTGDAIVDNAIQYIGEHVSENLSAQQIADYLDISREYLSSKFKKATGASLPDFINRSKIEVAKRLLRFTDKTLVAISNYLSYSSQSYFQTQFKRVTGMTPMEYRRSEKRY